VKQNTNYQEYSMTSQQPNRKPNPLELLSNSALKFRIIIPFVILIFIPMVALTSFVANTEQSSLVLLLISVLALLAVVGLGLLLARQLTRRIERIIDAAEQVAQGNLRVRINDNHHDEIGQLAQVFNQMTKNLEHLNDSRDLLSRTMSPAVRQSLLRRGLDFRGITQEVSILFVDIKEFTAITEGHNAEQVVFFLNDYYTTIANQIHGSGGIIGKYGGDSILAYFGAPDPEPAPKSATSALLSALALREAIDELSQRWMVLGLPPIGVGIGISLGEVVAGPIGSKQQFEYTVIGDAVNLASRLQGLTRNVPGFGIIMSSEVYQALEARMRDQIQIVDLQRYEAMSDRERALSLLQFVDFGEVLVKGKKGPVHVYGIPM
jgi:adenylate cyclase